MEKVSDALRDFKERDMGMDGAHWREHTYHELSHSRAHYLLAIEALRNDLGYARTTDIAEMLEVSRGAASMALTQLKKRGWVTEDPHRFLLLTEDGLHITELLAKNFDILRSFFEELLGMSRDEALANACKLEHIIDIDTAQRLRHLTKTVIGNPSFYSKLKRDFSAPDSGKQGAKS
jgi:DtxR family transcriptional regulator, Mn-dependent transcriptional regulator